MAVDEPPPWALEGDDSFPLEVGEIRMIEYDHQDESAEEGESVDCPECGWPVELAEPHVYMSVWIEEAPGVGYFLSPRFCSRPCFVGWAWSR